MSDIFPEPNLVQPNYRIAALKGFLPLSEDAPLSTRGQRLPSLISNRSSTNLAGLRQGMVRQASVYFGRAGDGTTPGAGAPGSLREPDLEQGRRRSEVDDDALSLRLNGRQGEGKKHSGERRFSAAVSLLMSEDLRSQRLIGNSNPRYRWEQYWKTDDELHQMKKPIRQYYERNNYLIQQYMYIDRLLDSSLPHNLIQEYNQPAVDVPATIREESGSASPAIDGQGTPPNGSLSRCNKVKRTPKDIYTIPQETTPLLNGGYADDDDDDADAAAKRAAIPDPASDEEEDSGARVVTVAIYINLVANTVLLILKVVATVLTSSVSVLASLVDAALDFLSTAIVWTTTRIISRGQHDTYNYPVGRRRFEPIGVLVFSVIMITSFVQVGLEALSKLTGADHEIVELSVPAIVIMASTVVVKFACWLWCRLIRNSSVQALAQDAMTDVVFNIFSIIFPLIGFYLRVWWLDPLGGLLLSFYVIGAWSMTSRTHILNLAGQAASKDERAVLLYLTMRFAHTIKKIQGIAAYHAGDRLNVEVDIVLSEEMSLRDSHDLSESLQYVLESVPGVERAFVHADYKSENLPNHMQQ